MKFLIQQVKIVIEKSLEIELDNKKLQYKFQLRIKGVYKIH